MLKLKQRQLKKYQKKCKLKKKELLLQMLLKKNMLLMRTTVVLFTHLSHASARGGHLTPLQVGRRFSKGNGIQFVPVLIQRKSYLKKTMINETNRILITLSMYV